MRNPAIRLGLGGLAAIAALALGALPAQASTANVNGSTLNITGDVDSDLITVSTDGTTLTVVDTGTGGVTEADTECATVNAQTVTCTINNAGVAPVNRFNVELSNGVDSFTNQNFVTFNGSVDADHPMGGPATGAKTIVGGPGNQFLDGGLDSDSISGGEGDDDFFDGAPGAGSPAPTGGNDILDGGPGEDSVGYNRAGNPPLSLSLDNAANDGQAGETDNLIDIETIFSGSGNDTLTGNALSNILVGGGGNDVIAGQGGNDLLFGEFAGGGQVRPGALRGGGATGPSNDTLIGGDGRDGLSCGLGTDVAIRDSRDEVDVTCERFGADVTGDSAAVTGKKQNKTKVELTCPDSEGAACAGKLKLTSNDKKIGKGSFSVGAGESKRAKVKLTKKGVKALKKANGSLLASVEVLTEEPGGVSQSVGTVLLFR